MRIVALQNRRGTNDVSLCFKDGEGGISQYLTEEVGQEVVRVLNTCLKDYLAGRFWSDGVIMNPGVYLIEADGRFDVVEINKETKYTKINRWFFLEDI